MRESKLHRLLPMAYVVVVTALLLALVAEQASHGPPALPGLVVYALAAGFGLEFVWSGWTAESRSRRGERPLRD